MAAAVVNISSQDDVDFSDFCRLCLQLPPESQVLDLNLVYDEEEQLTYSDCFTICTMIDLAADAGMPRNLCKPCGLELQVAYDFHKKVESSKRFLSQMKSTQIKAETEEEEKEVEEHVMLEQTAESSGDNSITNVEEVPMEQLESMGECEELEEHLEMDDYQAVEAIEDDEADWSTVKHEEQDSQIPEEEQISQLIIVPTIEIEFQSQKSYDGDEVRDSVNLTDNIDTNAPPVSSKKITTGTKRSSTVPRNTPALGSPPYMCEYCDHLSPTRALHASHRHRKHRLKTLPYQCSKCDKRFDTIQHLERHTRRPTCNVYPEFECEYCGKKCIGLSNYNVHLRFHKKQYPFVCQICAKRFMMATHLNNHVQTKHEHKRFFCEFPGCGKMFQTRHSLKIHFYVHLGTMPYRCDYCERTYPSKGRLRWHINKSHGIEHSLAELDRMLVAEKISITAKMKPILNKPQVEPEQYLVLDRADN